MNIRNLEVEDFAEAVSELTRETKTQAVKTALSERLIRIRRRQQHSKCRIQELEDIAKHCSSLPVLDNRADDGETIATIEIKGGKDPAGALERLGAMQKSFEETPKSCQNFLIAGVITPEMRSRLDNLGNVKVYLLDDISCDGEPWNSFIEEVFHYTVRII